MFTPANVAFRVMFASLVGMWKVRLFKALHSYLTDVMFNTSYAVLSPLTSLLHSTYISLPLIL